MILREDTKDFLGGIIANRFNLIGLNEQANVLLGHYLQRYHLHIDHLFHPVLVNISQIWSLIEEA